MAAGEPGPAGLAIHNFSARLAEQTVVHFHTLSMRDSFFLWVGAAPSLCNLAVAMCSRLNPIPVSTLVLGDTSDTTSSSLAQRLAKKTGKQVFVSYNLPNTSSNTALEVENRIKQEMDAHPEKF
ncbi:proteasome assembly chaperone 4 [Callorhinchus milii]|uniref:Proteasome assembly chaperone 4-like protein n=2 Tax=Callorhinchus milii TaxID=7868 RepID=V9LA31_CALMI|nr:proteasome assembly chaperone 4 [Callorhinchus milii]XP_042188395.1 proteasome assembly chaperone 4 [Callorhinchus milii]|eukprot:gi/632968970/ref/XP_007900828.1/ PREDICTED: proteasome assembly chaperone 4 [Callorhinchus milii]